MSSPPGFDDAVEPYLHDGEQVVAGAVLDGGWLAVTPDRWLVYAAAEDRLRAVARADVTGIEGTTTANTASLARAVRVAVYGLVGIGVGVGANRVGAALAAGLDGTTDVPAVGSLLALIDLVRRGVTLVGLIAPLVGALLLLVAVAFALRWYRSRRPTLVVETVDGPIRVAGTHDEIEGLPAALPLDDRPDPGTVLD
jgi:uncharacterized membrane protein (UPF0136 family)